jgi:hypothetical protein
VALASGRVVRVVQLTAGADDAGVGDAVWLAFPARAGVVLPP